jgi:2-hydroxy-3-keto-5-methylthiopentenyl-1-phosphate phosphatase
MASHPKYVFFTDFDGTITSRDSNDYLTNNLGYGVIKRKAGNAAVLKNGYRPNIVTFTDSSLALQLCHPFL